MELLKRLKRDREVDFLKIFHFRISMDFAAFRGGSGAGCDGICLAGSVGVNGDV